MNETDIIQTIMDFAGENNYFIVVDIPEGVEIGSITINFTTGKVELNEPYVPDWEPELMN